MSHADAEDAQFQKEAQEVKKWWTESRWRFTRRTFTAEEIVAKRGNLKIQYPSNHQSKKLWNIVEDRFKVKNLTQSRYNVLIAYRTKMLASHMAVSTQ
jgi:isocitrate lyase